MPLTWAPLTRVDGPGQATIPGGVARRVVVVVGVLSLVGVRGPLGVLGWPAASRVGVFVVVGLGGWSTGRTRRGWVGSRSRLV